MQPTGFSSEASQRLWNKPREDPQMNTTHTTQERSTRHWHCPQQQEHKAAAYWIIKGNQATVGFNFSFKKRNMERVWYDTGSLAYSGKY